MKYSAVLFKKAKNLTESVALYREILKFVERQSGADSVATANAMVSFSSLPRICRLCASGHFFFNFLPMLLSKTSRSLPLRTEIINLFFLILNPLSAKVEFSLPQPKLN